MTNETRNRIRQYTEELPHMKEKVFGALLMLVIATMVTVTSTYAWVTLSRSPEVSDIKTTFAANGALEIALAKSDGSQPEEFDIDESITSDNSLTVTNLQWGNLVNLSDASYGLDKMELRPAMLLDSDLQEKPLEVKVYGEDGRIAGSNERTTFAKYNEETKEFVPSNDYGVRAIISYKIDTSNATLLEKQDLSDAVSTAKGIVADEYKDVISSFKNLAPVITRKAQDTVNSSGYGGSSDTATNSDYASYLPAVREFYVALKEAMDAQKDAYVALANLQKYKRCKNNGEEYIAYASWEGVVADYNAGCSWLSITGLDVFMEDYSDLVDDLAHLDKYIATDGVVYYWSSGGDSGYNLSDMIIRLIDYTSMEFIIDGQAYTIGTIKNAASYLLFHSGSTYPAYVKDSILQRFEQYALDKTPRMNGNAQCTISLSTVVGEIVVNGKVYTTAEGDSWFSVDFNASDDNDIDARDKVAEDTYGIGIDLWVRTNAEETCLKLEEPTTTDEVGNYLSYSGVNRVWGYTYTDEQYPKISNTTQGGGSCYIYYAETPDDMERSLELVQHMKVAFISSEGELLAVAEMDTENCLAVNGRVTVPLVLRDDAKTTYTTEDGQTGFAITTLYANSAQRVTAIVYLDGNYLGNEHVLATALIQGSLNIQFSSSEKLDTVGDSELLNATRAVTATVDETEFTWGDDESDFTTNVTVEIVSDDGSKDYVPTTVTAFFVRAINDTQGSREKTMIFSKQSDGTWTASYTFAAPGTYYLRQVRLDGVDYTLEEPSMVVVDGFSFSNLYWSAVSGSERVTEWTSDSTYDYNVSVEFNTTDINKMPRTVQMSFYRESTKTYITVPLTYSAGGEWKGTGAFTISDTYQLRYLVMDGDPVDLALSGSYRTLELVMGLYVKVYQNGSLLTETYTGEDTIYDRDVTVEIFDNSGKELENLDAEELQLVYSLGGSGSKQYSANLTWNAIDGRYAGTLPLDKVGKYQFAYVQVDEQKLTKATEWPLYTILNPNPPEYVTSTSAYNDTVQYVLDNNTDQSIYAVINNIKIDHAESASASAVVYSETYGGYLEATMVWSESDGTWTVKLPAYSTGEGTSSTQGSWKLIAIYLWDCYYGSDTPRGEDNKILWVDSTSGDTYLNSLVDEEGNPLGVVADAVYDFSGLTATVKTYPKLTVNNKIADVAVVAPSGAEYTNEVVYCRPGDSIKVILRAKAAYYNPRLNENDVVTFDVDSISEDDKYTATYTFEMPERDLDIGQYVKATEAATVQIGSVTGGSMTVSYTSYDESLHTLGTVYPYSTGPDYVQPGRTVTVTVKASDGYYNPTASVSSGNISLEVESTKTFYGDCYDTITYTFAVPVGTEEVTLTASAISYPTVTLDDAGMTTLSIAYTGYTESTDTSVQVRPGTEVTVKAVEVDGYYNPTVSGVSFNTTTKDETSVTSETQDAAVVTYTTITHTFTMGKSAVKLVASATPYPTITHTKAGKTGGYLYVNDEWVDRSATYSVRPGATMKWDASYPYNSSNKSTSVVIGKYTSSATSGSITMGTSSGTITIAADASSCVTGETFITLADGTQVMIKDIRGDEMLLVWNHYTGEIDEAPVLAITDHYGVVEDVLVLTLQFSNGSYVEMIGEHVFFDYDMGRYVAITSNNVHEYVGHKFAILSSSDSDLEQVELVSYTEEVRETGVYEVNTVEHFVCFTNGVLSSAAYNDLFLNCHDFTGENLMFSEELIKADIEEYGLYTYDDFAEYISEELFYAFDLGKLKISVSKGYTTWERIVEICNIVMNANVDMGN